MTDVAVATTPAAPPAPTSEVVAPSVATPAGETPAPASDKTPAPAGETPAKPDDDQEKTERARHRRQLNTAYRKEAEARARADFLQKQIEELNKSKAPAVDAGEPKLEQFKSIEEFGEAVKKHASEQALKTHTEKQRSEQQKQEMDALTESYAEKVEKAVDKYDDFERVVGEVSPTTPWAIAAMEAENAADIMYFLGKNMEVARKINAMSPRNQIREIGRIEERLLANPPVKPKTPSKAPAPITPLTGAAPVVTDTPSESDDMKAWIAKRQKQLYGSRK